VYDDVVPDVRTAGPSASCDLHKRFAPDDDSWSAAQLSRAIEEQRLLLPEVPFYLYDDFKLLGGTYFNATQSLDRLQRCTKAAVQSLQRDEFAAAAPMAQAAGR
jgi:hypothetical protein